jgi:hypothetical protein
MCIVKLDRAATMEGIDGMAGVDMASDHHVLWRARKVMLLKAKLLTVDVFVVRIQGLVKVFGEDFGSYGTW